MILHFGDWHGEPPLVSWVYSERVLTSRVPLLLRGSRGGPQGSNSTSLESFEAPDSIGPPSYESGDVDGCFEVSCQLVVSGSDTAPVL